MLYKKNQSPTLEKDLFASPTSEYRGTPFWAWNTELEKEELLRQIEQLKEMGFGGFHMHSRSGMATPYLSEEFMTLVKACRDKAKSEHMLAWLYDEDRWPSGAAGGIVTKDPRCRQKLLLFTVNKNENAVDPETGFEKGLPYLVAAFDIVLNPDGTLRSYEQIPADKETVSGTKWYVYLRTANPSGWYNGQTYVDTLSPAAMDRFVEVTYESYKNAVGEDFGGTVPAIFTDEPQFVHKSVLPFAASTNDIALPYTTDFAETFEKAYGFDLIPHLPELLWDLPDGKPSRARYLYHDHVCERFTEAFSDKCGAWCDAHGINLTGHMMDEPTLHSQTMSLGEAMRAYRGFGLPGIDMLCDRIELSTAKQCASAVHQYAREGMLSELYGVTGWDFDFRGHIFQGDWQAALGVTVRVPHLSWVSMKGSAKRDYPASIHYQSAWYKEYPFVEDHFARLNTALTRGKALVDVAVIHPVESYWLHFGPAENTASVREQLEQNFNNVINWLLFGAVDFDFVSESLIPALHKDSETGFAVGAMTYKAVIVPGLETVRSTTLDALEAFADKGGKIIFMGDCPKYVDAVPSDRPKALYDRCEKAQFTSVSLLESVKDCRRLSIRNDSGAPADNLLYQMRSDGENRWLFVCAGKKRPAVIRGGNEDFRPQHTKLYVEGHFAPTLYDTYTGATRPLSYRHVGDKTVFDFTFYPSDSLLVRLAPSTVSAFDAPASPARKTVRELRFLDRVKIDLAEPNVLVLDMAEYSWDGKTYAEKDEVLRIDRALRRELGYPMADGRDCQPWCIEKEEITHFPYLRFTFESEIEVPCKLAFEEAAEVTFNGETVPVTRDGFFTDHAIFTMPLPKIRKGKNELIVKAPLGKRVSLENYFLLGDFGVRVEGSIATVTKKPEAIAFGSVTTQGFPFYGAALTYTLPLETPACALAVRTDAYNGALITARLDGKNVGRIVTSPYTLTLENVAAGAHTLELTVYASRVNCFGGLHNCTGDTWIGPGYWYSSGTGYAYEYQLKNVGILRSPVVSVMENA